MYLSNDEYNNINGNKYVIGKSTTPAFQPKTIVLLVPESRTKHDISGVLPTRLQCTQFIANKRLDLLTMYRCNDFHTMIGRLSD